MRRQSSSARTPRSLSYTSLRIRTYSIFVARSMAGTGSMPFCSASCCSWVSSIMAVSFCRASYFADAASGKLTALSLHVERVDVEGELDARRRMQRRPGLARQLVQLTRTRRLQLEVETEVVLQPKHRRLRRAEQTHLRRLPSLRLAPLLCGAERGGHRLGEVAR